MLTLSKKLGLIALTLSLYRREDCSGDAPVERVSMIHLICLPHPIGLRDLALWAARLSAET